MKFITTPDEDSKTLVIFLVNYLKIKPQINNNIKNFKFDIVKNLMGK